MSKKRKKKSVAQKIRDKLETIIKKIIYIRDGGVCQVQKHYPNIAINHSEVKQVDHCFSRTIKELYFDLANLTLICSTCNGVKGSNKIAVSKKDAITVAVHEIVKKREGEDVYNRLFEISSRLAHFPEWKNIAWLEKQIEIAEDILNEIKRSE